MKAGGAQSGVDKVRVKLENALIYLAYLGYFWFLVENFTMR